MKAANLTVNIYPMSEADVVEIKRIEVECNLSPWSIEDYYNEIKRADSVSLTAVVGKLIVGFVISRLITNYISLSQSYDEIEIYNLCVLSDHRRNGIGKSLVEKLAKIQNRNIKAIWLDVRKSNDNALCFYDKLTFKTIYTRKNFYRNPTEDGLVLKMEL